MTSQMATKMETISRPLRLLDSDVIGVTCTTHRATRTTRTKGTTHTTTRTGNTTQAPGTAGTGSTTHATTRTTRTTRTINAMGTTTQATIIAIIFMLCIPQSKSASLHQPPRRHDDTDDVTWRLRHHPDVGTLASSPASGILIDEPQICDRDPFVVVFVHSAPGNADRRSAIRKSWGSAANDPELRTRVVFVLGAPPNGTDDDADADGADGVWRRIRTESATYRDILQFDVADTYANLSLKSVAMLRWTAERCPGVRYVVKADDDTYVNAPLLVGDLRGLVHERFLMGDIIAGARPIRDRRSKYYTPDSRYGAAVYPTYLSGAAYVISGDLIAALTSAAGQSEPFWLEDVYVTGILGRRVQAKLIYNGKFAFRTQTIERCHLSRIIALHRIDPEEMVNAWRLTNEEKTKCGHRT